MAKISYMFVYFDGTEGGRHGLAWPRYPGGDFQVVSDHGQVGTVPNLQRFPGNHGRHGRLIKISLVCQLHNFDGPLSRSKNLTNLSSSLRFHAGPY